LVEERRPVTRFEDLLVWQRARELTAAVYRCTREEVFARDTGLASQLQRAAVSVMANIAEGFERRGPAEFARYLDIARASNAEVASHLYVALDVGYLSRSTFDELMEATRQLGAMLSRFTASVRRNAIMRPTPLGTGNGAPGGEG